MTKKAKDAAQALAAAPVLWQEEWVDLDTVQRHAPWQVRHKLNDKAVKLYRAQTEAGSVPPPIKVARLPNGALYLVDGWHRIEAGALQSMPSLVGQEVLAHVASLSEKDAQWEAARANMTHGVQLGPKDRRNVFRAFIKARKHRRPDGQFVTYRDIAAELGMPWSTLRNWMRQDFPSVFKAMGGAEGGNPDAEQPPVEMVSLEEQQKREALKALEDTGRGLEEMSAQGRWEVVEQLRRVMDKAMSLGVEEPLPEAF